MILNLTEPERALLYRLVELQRSKAGQVSENHGVFTRAGLDELKAKLESDKKAIK